MDEAPSEKDAEHFRHVASPREGLIENTPKSPCLNRSYWGTSQMRCASSLSLASSEAAGCDVQHASVDGDRLIVLTELGVSDSGGEYVVVGDDKTFSYC